MSLNCEPNFSTLPMDLIYRILDYLDPLEVLLSIRDTCMRLNVLTDIYHRFQVRIHPFYLRIARDQSCSLGGTLANDRD